MIMNQSRSWLVKIEDKIATRWLDNVYLNNTGRTRIVSVSLRFETLLSTDQSTARPNVSSIDYAPIGIGVGAITKLDLQLIMLVPPGSNYQITRQVSGSGVLSVNTWVESD